MARQPLPRSKFIHRKTTLLPAGPCIARARCECKQGSLVATTSRHELGVLAQIKDSICILSCALILRLIAKGARGQGPPTGQTKNHIARCDVTSQCSSCRLDQLRQGSCKPNMPEAGGDAIPQLPAACGTEAYCVQNYVVKRIQIPEQRRL